MDCGFGEDCYPSFTAEKQLELVKWLAKNKFVVYNNLGGYFFKDYLARLINNLWQNLSPEEKKQIKEILE